VDFLVLKRFLLFKRGDLYRYIEELRRRLRERDDQVAELTEALDHLHRGGGCTAVRIQLTHSLKPPGFQPLNPSNEKLVFTKFVAFANPTCAATPRRGGSGVGGRRRRRRRRGGGGGGEVLINRSSHQVKPFFPSGETVLPIE
jgi:hypothetical protein